MHGIISAILAAIVALHAPPARADDWVAFAQPRAIALMRHALAPGTGDPQGFVLGDCSTQRNLDDRGRAQARAVGAALRARGLRFDEVLTSRWCRARETAEELALAPVRDAPALDSFFGRLDARLPQTEAMQALISGLDGRALLVTHQVNITALTGRSIRSGEVIIVRPDEAGITVLGTVFLAP